MSNTLVTHCQALLLDQPHTRFCKTSALNPAASLLPDDVPEEPLRDCPEVMDLSQAVRPDLTNALLQKVDEVLHTEGSSFVQNRIRYNGAAVETQDGTVWLHLLNQGSSAQ